MDPKDNKFHLGNSEDGKHYWITPPDMYAALNKEFAFDFDPCPFPLPVGFDGLSCEWGSSNYANIPFGSIVHNGKKKGPTAWMRKAIVECKKGKRVVIVYPVDKWILMMLAAGAKVRNLGDIRWCATEDGSQGKGTGRHIAAFILEPEDAPAEQDGAGLVQSPNSASLQCAVDWSRDE
jgi:DNA N-6-adenine-methyltransferase (Dam).